MCQVKGGEERRSRWETQSSLPDRSIVPSSDRARSEIEKLGLVASALPAAPDVETVDVDLPRVAIFTTWSNTEKVGWVRLAFDRFEIPFDLIHKDHVKQGNLRSKYDVIVMPHQGNSAKSIVYELPKLSKPLPYRKSEQFKSFWLLHRDRRCAWRDGDRRCRGVPAVRGRRGPARHDGDREQLSSGVRPGEGRGHAGDAARFLRAGPVRPEHCADAVAPRDVRVYAEDAAGSVRRRAAAAGRSAAGLDGSGTVYARTSPG